jgi:hypothetical protein
MTASLIHQMYIAYYQRPADPAGLVYWQAQLTANGGGETGWNTVAAAFANAAESSALYGSQTLSQKISAIYLASFERAAVDSEVTFWVDSGFTEAQIAFAIVNGAQNDDLTTVSNKETYAVNFVATLDPAGTGVGPFEYEYSDPSIGRTLVGAITASSDVSSATVAAQVAENVPSLVTVSLTSGQDTITPTSNAVENISGALGGSAPSLGRTDKIDGGSANDTMSITTDGNFLLGFSTGYIKNVETINLTTTVTSVTTKLINLTGVSGVTTYNVGASKAAVQLSEVSDVGITVNLSGQSTGTFQLGFATGAISASGSAMTIGVSDVGTTGDAVQMITQGVTDLTIVASGINNTESFVNLNNSSNDYQTITVIGSSDLFISDVGANASALEASSFAGDLTFTVDTDTNTELAASGKTITGGAGTDTMRLLGSGIVGATTSSVEELFFDGSSGETIVRATGMAGIQTLTFSGQNAANAPSISGLDATARTINAILDDSGPLTQTYSAGGALTVNLKVDPALVAAKTQSDNDFTLTSTNTGSTTINVDSWVSSNGTLTLSNTTGVSVAVHTSSHFGNTIKANKAQTVIVEGGADIDATVTALAATTISFNVGSGTIALGSTAITTFSLVNSGSATISAKASGVTTITVDTQSEANLDGFNTTGLTTLQISGSGSLAAAQIGAHSGVSTDLTMSLIGLGGGFSAAGITKISSDLTLAATTTEGFLYFDAITASGVTITTGTIQNFHADAINAEKFTFDGAAATSTTNSASVGMGFLTASSTVTIALGAGTGVVSAAGLHTLGAVTVDASNFSGTLNLPSISGSGVTVSLGVNGMISSATVNSGKAFTLDGSIAASSNIALGLVEASSNATISLGSGTGSLAVGTGISAGGLLVIDASKSGGTFDVFNMTASGATISLGTSGDFSANSIQTDAGGFTLDGAVSTSAQITISTITASANITIALGAGSGAVAVTGMHALGAVTLDASSYGGTLDFNEISGSGVSIVSGSRGDFSAQDIVSTKGFTFDGSIAASGTVAFTNVSSSGAVVISMGSGTGSLTTLGINSTKAVTIDASKYSGTMDFAKVSGSGATISLGLAGNLSASAIISTKAFTLDGAAAISANVIISQLDASSNVTLSLGTAGSGSITLGSASAAGTFTLDATSSKATIDIANISASGTISIVTGTSGDFSASTVVATKGFVLDASNASGASISMVTVSVGNTDSSITMGSGTGSLSANVIATDADFTIDMSKSNAAADIATISASGLTISLGAAGNFSANLIAADKAFTFDGSGMVSADITLTAVSAVDSISITLAGSANISSQSIDTVDTFTLTAAGASESLDITNISASGISLTTGIQGDFSSNTMYSKSTMVLDASGATTAQGISITSFSASGAVTVTLGSGSGQVSLVTATSNEKAFTLAATRFDGEIDITSISASGVTISIGSGGDFSASSIASAGLFTFNAQNTDASGETINLLNVAVSGVSMNMAAASNITAEASSMGAGGGNFAFSGTNFNGGLQILQLSASGASITTGANFVASAQSVVLTDNFTLNGAALTSANITVGILSASGTVSMSFGSMTGDLVLGKVSTLTDIRLSAEGAAGLGMTLGDLSASGITITLGEASDTSNNFSASVIDANTFTLNASLFRDSINLHHVSAASAVTITAGDLTDDLTISALTTEMFTLNGGDGSNFSASLTSSIITGSAWSITMAELGNGLSIVGLSYSANWTIKGTQGIDSISALSIAGAGTTTTVDFDMREDSVADVINLEGSSGATYAILRNFDSGEDSVRIDFTAGAIMAITAAASMISTVLGSTLTSTDIASAATSLYTYNSDTYFVSDEEDAAGTFGNGDFVIRFVGVTDILQSDIGIDA